MDVNYFGYVYPTRYLISLNFKIRTPLSKIDPWLDCSDVKLLRRDRPALSYSLLRLKIRSEWVLWIIKNGVEWCNWYHNYLPNYCRNQFQRAFTIKTEIRSVLWRIEETRLFYDGARGYRCYLIGYRLQNEETLLPHGCLVR